MRSRGCWDMISIVAEVSRSQFGERLLDRLRLDLGSGVGFSEHPSPFGGGAFSELFKFQLRGAPSEWSGMLVLRLVPGSNTGVRIEAAVQEGARVAGVPAPRVLLVDGDPEALGAPFMIMEMLAGRPFLRTLWHQFPRDFPRLVASWPDVFGEVLSLLMGVDTAPIADALSASGIPADAAGTGRHLAWSEQVLGGSHAFDGVISWLKTNQPDEPARPSVVHGDLWPGNVLMHEGAFGGLVDWTMGAVGDPALDVGFATVGLALMPEPFPPPWPVSAAIRAAGAHIAKQIHERCRTLVGGAERIAYYEALRCVVQLAVVHADRQRGVWNGWEHGVSALIRHLNGITGLGTSLTGGPTKKPGSSRWR